MKTLALLRAAGYGMTERVLDASLCGVPQKRSRLFVIGKLGEADGFLDENLLSHVTEEPLSVRSALGSEIAVEHFYRHPRYYSGRAVFSVDEPAPTIRGTNSPPRTGHPEARGNSAPVSSVRRLTFFERARIQAFPADFKWIGIRTDIEKMIGNAVPVALAYFVGKAVSEYAVANDNTPGQGVAAVGEDMEAGLKPKLTSGRSRVLEGRPTRQASGGAERLPARAGQACRSNGSSQNPACVSSAGLNSALYLGDCIELLRSLPANSIDASIISHLIKLFTTEGQVVLDPFTGSGSHGVAAIESGRRFVGIEIEPKYYAISQRRISQAESMCGSRAAAA